MAPWPIPWLARLLARESGDGDLAAVAESTRRFVSLLRLPPPHPSSPPGMVYLLASEALSERSAVDAAELVRAIKPAAVVAQVGNGAMASLRSEEEEEECGGDGNGSKAKVPTNVFEVVRDSFVDRSQRDSVDSRAGAAVLRSIFGTTYHGPVLSAKKAAREAKCSFVFLETPGTGKDECKDDQSGGGPIRFGQMVAGFREEVAAARSGLPGMSSSIPESCSISETGSSAGSEEEVAVDVSGSPTFGRTLRDMAMVSLRRVAARSSLQRLSSSPLEVSGTLIDDETVTSSGEDRSSSIQSRVESREFPAYATSFYSLLVDLHDAYRDLPGMNTALNNARSLLFEIERGGAVDRTELAGAQNFRLAVESLRVALAAAGSRSDSGAASSSSRRFRRAPKFEEMSSQDQGDVLLAQALREQARAHGTVVAVVDASSIAGIRRQWNTPVAAEVRDRAREFLVAEFVCGGGGGGDGDDNVEHAIVSPSGAAAIVGLASLPWWASATPPFAKVLVVKAPVLVKLGLVNLKRNASVLLLKSIGPVLTPGKTLSAVVKSAATAGKARAAAHSVVASAERATLSAIRTAFYCLMRKKQGMSSGGRPWLVLGGSVAAAAGILWSGDRLEAAIEAVPAAPGVARLGRGLENLERTSRTLREERQRQREWDNSYRRLYK